MSFATIWYFTYYRAKYLRRMKKQPELQAKLDAEFEVRDDWKYVSLEIRHEIKNYLERNQALYQATNNVNYQDAEHLLTELNLIIKKSSSLDEKKDESVHKE